MPDKPTTYNQLVARQMDRRNPKRLASSRFTGCARWRKLRDLFLSTFPLCFDCAMAADQVHHIVDRHDAPHLKFEWSNLMSLCRKCHSRRTGRDTLHYG